MNHFENQYLNIMRDIVENGESKIDRTQVGTKSVFCRRIDIDLADGFPMPTTRKTTFRLAFEEIQWMLRGQVDSKILEAKKINIWKGNTTREFLDKRGLNYLPEGHIGKGYGFQWRNFGGDYKIIDYKKDSHGKLVPVYDYYQLNGKGADQIATMLKDLSGNPNGRRHIVSAWNPQQEAEMSLPPCHLYQQYAVNNGRLDSMFLMRSNDFVYGNPFNMMGYAYLNHVFSKVLKLKPGRLVYEGVDVHIYNNQLKMAEEQITRVPYDAPQLIIHKDLNSLQDILDMEYKDVEIVGYDKFYPDFKDKPAMAV